MCGIICGVAKRNVVNIIVEGLRKLEYRGYDSVGLAVINSKSNLIRIRTTGKIPVLLDLVKKHLVSGNIGIGHTRWATHGKINQHNTHPHVSDFIAIVHNGIIENYHQLRKKLKDQKYKFYSETDSEVIAHLTHLEFKNGGSLIEAVKRCIAQLKGSYSIVIMDARTPELLVGVKWKSPLVIGLGVRETFFASDQLALLSVADHFIYLEDGDIAEVTWNNIKIFNHLGYKVKRKRIENKLHDFVCDKGLYKHYMEKEIYEQPITIQNTFNKYVNIEENIFFDELSYKSYKILSNAERVQIVACGSSYNAAMVARYWFESLIEMPCDIEIASEYCYRKHALNSNTLMMILSQSGETADILSALLISKKLKYLARLAICNVPSSTLARESDFVLLTQAGIEVSVASTKTFTAQLTIILLLIGFIGRIKHKNILLEKKIISALKTLPTNIKNVFVKKNYLKQVAEDLVNKKYVFFIGRGIQYPIAIEGALKLKEISYIYAEGYAAGELKHGPLALVDFGIPVIIMAPTNNVLKKMQSNIEEISARGGYVYIFTDKNASFNNIKNKKIIYLPNVSGLVSPILYVIPLQLLSYYVSILKGTNIDQPRNLAKSVTVE
uniref:Glutamine--fructose-6-phosphate aminotransferase [isomerizing] n=1 Tax=Candidatus Aschnera chinzeii TaxID=1485666 RepID=A0AAT9G455_9ENTR|nr:MAG: glutamine--fructose-6-phosphate transaminase (isomerizing) [Candidatus Aschnera chinzeii]